MQGADPAARSDGLMAHDPNPPTQWKERKEDLLPYLRRLIVTIVVIALAVLLWELREVLLLAFAAVLIAVALLALTGSIRKLLRIGHRAGLGLASVIAILFVALVIWLVAPAFQEQLARLVAQVNQAWDQVQTLLTGVIAPEDAQEIVDTISNAVNEFWPTVLTVAGGLVNVLTMVIVVVFSGLFLAVDPGLYRRGTVLMFPRDWHDRIRRGLDECGNALRLWLRAQLLAMLAVGTLVGLGTAAIGLPAPLALGLIAGLTEFVPILGPIIGALPAILVALGSDGSIVIWTILLYIAVRQIESNLITPVLQRRIVSIPPALLLLSFVALGTIFGAFGIIVAAPLSIAIFILVREFYVGDLLAEGDQLSEPKPADGKTTTAGKAIGDVAEP